MPRQHPRFRLRTAVLLQCLAASGAAGVMLLVVAHQHFREAESHVRAHAIEDARRAARELSDALANDQRLMSRAGRWLQAVCSGDTAAVWWPAGGPEGLAVYTAAGMRRCAVDATGRRHDEQWPEHVELPAEPQHFVVRVASSAVGCSATALLRTPDGEFVTALRRCDVPPETGHAGGAHHAILFEARGAAVGPMVPTLRQAWDARRESVDVTLAGESYVFGVARVAAPGNQVLALGIGLPSQEVLETVLAAPAPSIALLAGLWVLCVGAALAASEWLAVRPLLDATATAERLARGERTARTGARTVITEIAALSSGLDVMAAALQEKEQALEDARHRYEVLVEQAVSGIYVATTDRFLFWNAAGARMFGYAPEEVIDRLGPIDLTHPDDRDLVARNFHDRLEGNAGSMHYRFRGLRKDGSTIHCEVSGTTISYEGQKVVLGTLLDVTDRVRAEQSLAASEQRLRALLDAAPIGIYLSNREGVVVEANQTFMTLVGRTRLPMTLAEVVDAGDHAALRAQRERVLAYGNMDAPLEYHIAAAGKPVRAVRETVTTVPVGTAGELLVLGLVEDVSRLKQIDRDLTLLSRAVQQTVEAVTITDQSGVIQYVNPSFERVTGFTSAEVVGHRPNVLRSGQHEAAFYDDLWRTILSGQVWQGHVTNRRRDGSLFTEYKTITPVRDTDGRIRHFIAVGLDVTAQRQLEAELLQAQKMEAIGRLSGGVAHDFNNLLTIILSSAEHLQQVTHAPELRRTASEITEAGQRAATLTRQLLAFARKQVAKPTVVPVQEAVTGLVNLLRRVLGEDVAIVAPVGQDVWPVRIDRTQFDQVLMNLAINARDAMPGGGTLTIDAANTTLDDPLAALEALSPGDYVTLRVSDTGHGMDEPTRARIFEPFFTTKDVAKGSGLGLSTVYGIVAGAAGRISVESAPGAGTCFTIRLPRGQATRSDAPTPVATTPRAGTETVLLVDDEPAIRSLFSKALGRMGYDVLVASGVRQAQDIIGAGTEIAVVVTDFALRDGSGADVQGAMHRHRPGVPIIFMSGYATGADSLAQGPFDECTWLEKPFSTAVLTAAVRRALEGEAARLTA